MADRVGQQFGDYRLTRYLGGGGFADVYLAEHIYLGTKAAVKVLKGAFTKEEIAQFRAEAGQLLIVVTYAGGREWRATRPLPASD